jgi:membrane associated rhomboid family serine protease
MAADPQNLAPARSVDEDKLIAGHHFRFHFGRRRPSPSGSHLTGTIVFITWVFYIATEIFGTFGEFTRLVLNLFAPAWATKFLGKALFDGKALFEALILDPPKVWRCPVEKPGILTAALRTFFPSLAAPKACGQWWRMLTVVLTHSGLTHIQCNMGTLKELGCEAEARLGHFTFILLYLFSGAVGSLFSLYMTASRACGASGAIYGLLGWRLGHLFMDTLFFKPYNGAHKKDDDVRATESLDLLRRSKQAEFDGCWRSMQTMVLCEAALLALRIAWPFISGTWLANYLWFFYRDGVDHWAHLGGFLGGFFFGVCGKLLRSLAGPTRIFAELDAQGRPALVATASAYAVKAPRK